MMTPRAPLSAEVPPAASVVIVGAGVIGLSLAFELTRRRVQPLVLEWRRVGAGATGVAAGMLAPASEAEHENPDLVRLAVDSLARYPEFVQAVEEASGLACGYRREGTLLVAPTRDDEAEIGRLRRFQETLGLPASWLGPEEVRGLEPQLSPRITRALFSPDDHQVDPRALVGALDRAVRASGGQVVVNARVTGFELHHGRVSRVIGRRIRGTADPDPDESGARSVVAPAARNVPERPGLEEPFAVRCDAAVLAGGAWSSQDVAWPAPPLSVRPVKGQLVRLQGLELLRHVVRAPQVYLVPRVGGDLIVGATMEEQGFDPTPTAGAAMDLLWNARLIVPAVYDLRLAEVGVGFRPATRDHLPVIGATDVPGLYAATGHFRHGVLLAPATAGLLADLIVGGRVDGSLVPFRPQRLAEANPLGRPAHG